MTLPRIASKVLLGLAARATRWAIWILGVARRFPSRRTQAGRAGSVGHGGGGRSGAQGWGSRAGGAAAWGRFGGSKPLGVDGAQGADAEVREPLEQQGP